MSIHNEAPRYNLITPQAPTYKNLPLTTKILYKCTPPFCDGMPKGNHNPSSKGGGGGNHLKCSKSVRKAQSSLSMSTKI